MAILLSIIIWFVRLDRCDDTDQICLIKKELRDYSSRPDLPVEIPDLRYRDGKIAQYEDWMLSDVALIDIANAFAYAGDTRSAFKIVDRIKVDLFKACAFGEIAGTFGKLGDKEKADALFPDVIKAMERIDTGFAGVSRSIALRTIAVSFGQSGEKEKVRSLLLHWIKEAEKDDNLFYKEDMQRKAAQIYTELGEITKDSDYLEEAINRLDRTNSDLAKYENLIKIAKSYAELGEKEKARSLLLQATKLATDEAEIWSRRLHLNEVVHVCVESVEFTKDRAFLEDATNVMERMGDSYYKIEALNAIAESYARLGDKDKARASLKNAIETADRTGNGYFKVLALNATVISYAWLGEKKKARALLSDTLKIAEGISDRNFKGGSLSEIAISYARLGEMTKDRALLDEAINIADRIGAYEFEFDNTEFTERGDKAGVLSAIAESYARLGEATRDIALLEEAVRIMGRISEKDLRAQRIKSFALFEIVSSYIKLAQSSNDPELFLVDNILKQPLPDYCKNQALDAILASKSKSELADVGKLRSLTSHYSNEAGKALALTRILMACSRPDLIGKERNLEDGGAR